MYNHLKTKKHKRLLNNKNNKIIKISDKIKINKWECKKIWNYEKKGGKYKMTELSKAFDFFQENGFVVIQDVITKNQNKKGVQFLMNDINKINSKKNNFNSVNKIKDIINQSLPGWASNGIRVQFGISHGEFANYSRKIANIKQIFSFFLKCKKENLCCSWDSIAVTPYNAKHKKKLWLHIDQSITNNKNQKLEGWNQQSIQGALYYTDVNSDTVSFVCVPGSHKKWKYIAENNKTEKGHQMMLENIKNDKLKKEILENAYRIHLNKNSFLLWNAKTFHQNCDTLSKKKTKNNQLKIKRIASFISMSDKKLRNKNAFKNSLIFAVNGTTTTHWAQIMKQHSRRFPLYRKNNCYEKMIFLKPKINPELNSQYFQQVLLPVQLKNKNVNLENIHLLSSKELNYFSIESLKKIVHPEILEIQPQ